MVKSYQDIIIVETCTTGSGTCFARIIVFHLTTLSVAELYCTIKMATMRVAQVACKTSIRVVQITAFDQISIEYTVRRTIKISRKLS